MLCIHVGQCGIQLGGELWRTLSTNEYIRDSSVCSPLIQNGKMRAVWVDSESKAMRNVTQSVLRPLGLTSTSTSTVTAAVRNVVTGSSGYGSNWAYGYRGDRHNSSSIDEDGNGLLDRTLEYIRREVETCDVYAGCVLTHSVGGGTGSGMGSRLIEEIRDYYPSSYIVSATVSPFCGGESPFQHYNSVLTYASLHQNADVVLLFPNDWSMHAVSSAASTTPKTMTSEKNVSMKQLNEHIAGCVAGLIAPSSVPIRSGDGMTALGMWPLWDLTASVAPIPGLNFAECARANETRRSTGQHRATSWNDLGNRVIYQLRRFHSDARRKGIETSSRPLRTLAARILVRGDVNGEFAEREQGPLISKLHKACSPMAWNPFPFDCWIAPKESFRPNRSLTLCANRNGCTDILEYAAVRSCGMLGAGAYLHWFEQFGVSADRISDATNSVNDIVNDYDYMTSA